MLYIPCPTLQGFQVSLPTVFNFENISCNLFVFHNWHASDGAFVNHVLLVCMKNFLWTVLNANHGRKFVIKCGGDSLM